MGVADTSLALMVMMGAKTRALKAFTEPEYVMYIAVSSRCAIYMDLDWSSHRAFYARLGG